MSNPTSDDSDAPGGHIAYAPKWVRNRDTRDADHLTSPSIADSEFPEHDDRSLTEQLINPPRTARSLNRRLNEARQERSGWDQASESTLQRSRERPISERDLLRRSLEPEVLTEAWPPRRGKSGQPL